MKLGVALLRAHNWSSSWSFNNIHHNSRSESEMDLHNYWHDNHSRVLLNYVSNRGLFIFRKISIRFCDWNECLHNRSVFARNYSCSNLRLNSQLSLYTCGIRRPHHFSIWIYLYLISWRLICWVALFTHLYFPFKDGFFSSFL